MLSGYDVAIVAFDDEEGFYCRACTVKAIGESAVQRLEAGLSDHIGRWTRGSRYEVDEQAVHNGYEFGADCADPEHAKLRADADLMWSRDKDYCPGCAVTLCFECGKRLDTTPEEEAAAA